MWTARRAMAFAGLGLRKLLSYREDFLIGAIATAIFHASNLGAVFLVFSLSGGIHGWSPRDGVFLAAASSLRFALGGIGLWGLTGLPKLIVSGDLDRILLYPCSPISVIMLRDIDALSLIDVLMLTGTLLWSLPRHVSSTLSIVSFLALVALGLVATYGFMLFAVSLSFWAKVRNMFPQIFRVLWEFQPYPTTIYPSGLRFLLTWIVPIAVAVVVPTEGLTLRQPLAALFLIAASVAVVDLVLGSMMFAAGLRKYESTGH